jgi:hypothetical protein
MSVPFSIFTGKGNTREYVVNSNSVYPVSSYTGMPVTLSVSLSSLPLSANRDFIVFAVNDKFVLKENNSVYNFPLPGVYKITLFTADLSGEPVENYTTYLSAFNFITDVINPTVVPVNNVYNSSSTSTSGINQSRTYTDSLTIAAAQYSDPIYVYRYNTWQLCNSLSSIDYKIELYCDGSFSNDYENRTYFETNWYHLVPFWQFRNETQTTIIRSLSTDSTNLYLTYDGYTGNVSTLSSVNSIFVGTSGQNIFYFKDDSPTQDTFEKLYLTQSLKDVPLAKYILDNKLLSIFERGLPIINNSSTIIETFVDYTVPTSWSFTSNGLSQPPLPNIMFNGTSFPLFIAPADSEGNILKYYGQMNYLPTSSAFITNSFKLALLSADGSKNALGNNNLFPTNFQYDAYEGNNISTILLSSFYAGVLSASYTNNFETIGATTNFSLSTAYTTLQAPFAVNPVVLSAFGFVRDTDGAPFFIEGLYLFNYYPEYIEYNIMKINENFDYVEALKSYALMPRLKDQTSLFDDFFAYVGGTQESSPNSIGKRYYEKIANFVDNNVNVDGANITQLYGLFDEINYKDKNYNIKFPADLQRVMDILSINYSRLIGYDTGFNSNYENSVVLDAQYSQTNLGPQLNNSSIINAGQNIVTYQYFGDVYSTVTPTTIACNSTELSAYSAANPESVDTTFNGLSSYPLSCYKNNWGWGLPVDVTWSSINQQYNFYLQTPTVVTDINKLNSFIDWNNNLTTLSAIQYNDNLSTYFTMSGGLMEQYIGNALRRGVGLI